MREGRGVECRWRGIGGSNYRDLTKCLAMNELVLCNFVSFRFSFEKKTLSNYKTILLYEYECEYECECECECE